VLRYFLSTVLATLAFTGCDQQGPVGPQLANTAVATPAVGNQEAAVVKVDAQDPAGEPDMQGEWQITRVHVLAGNNGQWAEDDRQIVGARFDWNTPDNLSGALQWKKSDDVSFDQSDICTVPELAPLDMAKSKDITSLYQSAEKAWQIKGSDPEYYGIRCKDGGSWGVRIAPSNGDDLYGVVRQLGPDKIFMAVFSDYAFLAERKP
jgi:hypothetical protein